MSEIVKEKHPEAVDSYQEESTAVEDTLDEKDQEQQIPTVSLTSVSLKVLPLQNLQVSMANDSMMDCKGMIRGMKLQLESYELSSDFYVVALSGADVVIGAQWLKNFGKFHMNLELYLKFEEGQQLIIIRGLQLSENKLISANKMSNQLSKSKPYFIFQCNSMTQKTAI
jgi:hypothetical protein